MINDDILSANAAKRIIAPIAGNHTATLKAVAHAKTQEANNDVITCQRHGLIGQANTIAWSCLPGNSYVAFDV